MKQRPIQEVILDDNTDPEIRRKLIAIEDILAFAHQELHLPDNGSYRKYADLQRRFVVWNVFAAPELSLRAKQWCYPIVGCMSYRGYFNEDNAYDYANTLQTAGWEIYVGGVSAYSTLGWFRDPVMNTMLNRDTWELARLIFHELAHQRLYVANDTEFNEAFADAVAIIGLEKWLLNQPTSLKKEVETQLSREDQFITMVLAARGQLATIYESALSDQDKRTEKARIIANLKKDYNHLKTGWSNDNSYDGWINNVNNARLSALSAYRKLVPDFLEAYREAGQNLQGFYLWVESLGKCEQEQRLLELRKFNENPAC